MKKWFNIGFVSTNSTSGSLVRELVSSGRYNVYRIKIPTGGLMGLVVNKDRFLIIPKEWFSIFPPYTEKDLSAIYDKKYLEAVEEKFREFETPETFEVYF